MWKDLLGAPMMINIIWPWFMCDAAHVCPPLLAGWWCCPHHPVLFVLVSVSLCHWVLGLVFPLWLSSSSPHCVLLSLSLCLSWLSSSVFPSLSFVVVVVVVFSLSFIVPHPVTVVVVVRLLVVIILGPTSSCSWQ